ncbi:RDD family protein [Kitasatospora aburaviensis]
MSTSDPSGYGYPSGQNPYDQSGGHGQQPPRPEPRSEPLRPGPVRPAGAVRAGPLRPGPYGQQDPYGQQPQGGYGAPPFGQPPFGQPQGGWPHWLPPTGGPYGGAPIPGSRQLAPIGERLLARLIDVAVLLIPNIVLFLAVKNSFLLSVATALLAFGYEAVMLITQGGQTLGKKALRLRAVDLGHGGKAAEGGYLARAAVYSLPGAVYCIGSLFALLNVLWPLWDKPLQQALHDKAAKTIVVKES